MAEAGTSLQVIGGQRGHRQTATTERYAHLSLAPVAAASHYPQGTPPGRTREGVLGGSFFSLGAGRDRQGERLAPM